MPMGTQAEGRTGSNPPGSGPLERVPTSSCLVGPGGPSLTASPPRRKFFEICTLFFLTDPIESPVWIVFFAHRSSLRTSSGEGNRSQT